MLSAKTLNVASLDIIALSPILTTFIGTNPLYSGFSFHHFSKIDLLSSNTLVAFDIIALPSLTPKLAQAKFSCPLVPLKPIAPLRLSIVFPVSGLTVLPVVSWSVIENIVGIPSTTLSVVDFKGESVLLFNPSTLIGLED